MSLCMSLNMLWLFGNVACEHGIRLKNHGTQQIALSSGLTMTVVALLRFKSTARTLHAGHLDEVLRMTIGMHQRYRHLL